jgi:hypothetical protein
MREHIEIWKEYMDSDRYRLNKHRDYSNAWQEIKSDEDSDRKEYKVDSGIGLVEGVRRVRVEMRVGNDPLIL